MTAITYLRPGGLILLQEGFEPTSPPQEYRYFLYQREKEGPKKTEQSYGLVIDVKITILTFFSIYRDALTPLNAFIDICGLYKLISHTHTSALKA